MKAFSISNVYKADPQDKATVIGVDIIHASMLLIEWVRDYKTFHGTGHFNSYKDWVVVEIPIPHNRADEVGDIFWDGP